MITTPHIDSHSTTDPKPEIQSAVLTGSRISRDGSNVRGIMHVHMCRKDDIFRQRQLNHSGVGGGIEFRRVYPARAYLTLVVLVFLNGSFNMSVIWYLIDCKNCIALKKFYTESPNL